MSAFFRRGVKVALEQLGMAKEPAPEDWSTGAKLQAGAVGAAGLAPFAGMVGQAPLQHDPHMGGGGVRAKSFQEMQGMAQPGDVMLTTKPGGSVWKHFISPVSGSEFYHAQPIVGRRNGQGLSESAGAFAHPDYAKDTPAVLRSESNTLADAMKADHYEGGVLLRPKNMSGAERKLTADKSLNRLKREYDYMSTPSLYLKELFMPKVEGLTNLGKQTTPEGNVCSTLPAMAAHEATGGKHQVVPGKAAKDVFPTDFLRSNEYEAVSHHLPPSMEKLSPEWIKARKLLARGALGAGMAGATYAATEDPAYAAAPLGGLAAYKATQGALSAHHPAIANKPAHAAEEALDKVFPPVFQSLEAMTEHSPSAMRTLKRFGTRTLPTIAGGTLAGYLGARGLEHLYDKYKNSSSNGA